MRCEQLSRTNARHRQSGLTRRKVKSVIQGPDRLRGRVAAGVQIPVSVEETFGPRTTPRDPTAARSGRNRASAVPAACGPLGYPGAAECDGCANSLNVAGVRPRSSRSAASTAVLAGASGHVPFPPDVVSAVADSEPSAYASDADIRPAPVDDARTPRDCAAEYRRHFSSTSVSFSAGRSSAPAPPLRRFSSRPPSCCLSTDCSAVCACLGISCRRTTPCVTAKA